MKIRHLTHWDLDGSGCVINVMNSIPKGSDYVWKASGYGKIEKLISELDKSFDVLFVTDLNYTESQFRLLGELKKKSNQIIFIDHHTYPTYNVEELGKELGIRVIWDRRFSGTLNTSLFLHGLQKNPQLTELTKLIDIYDLWKKTDDDFKRAHALNDLFWEYSMYKFVDKFKDGYKLDDEDKKVIVRKHTERKEHLEFSFKNKSIINEEQSILMVMNPDSKFTNDFTLFYPDFDVYLILAKAEEDTFQFSVRINPRIKLTINDIYTIMSTKLTFKMQCGGHDITGGLTILQSQMSEFMQVFNDSVAEWRTNAG